MNGAELPCGSILHVEPADPQYKQRKAEPATTKYDEDVAYYGPPSGTTMEEKNALHAEEETATRNTGEDNNPGDDLDDFFDSLT